MIPQLNNASDELQMKSGKKRPPMAVISKATGSIINLIEQTPENIIKPKKHTGKLYEGNEIFKPFGFQKLSNDLAQKRPEYVTGSSDPLNFKIYEERNRNNR
jgi:hypothetical protein